VLGALFVAEVTSVVVQIMAVPHHRAQGVRMAPFHHHFELVGWAETTVIIRFWLTDRRSPAVGCRALLQRVADHSRSLTWSLSGARGSQGPGRSAPASPGAPFWAALTPLGVRGHALTDDSPSMLTEFAQETASR
jgi:hypothetical protein